MGVPINNVSRRVVYAASGTGPYAFTFEILAAADIAVYKDDTLLTLTTDYTVTINANGTGSITLTASPTGATQIAIVGNRTIQRLTDFVTGGDLFANTINDELDQQTIFAQQNAEGLQRALQAPQTDPTTINMTLPRASVRASKVLSFDASGNPAATEFIGSNRGNWAAGTLYYVRDIVKDTSTSNIWQCQVQHTSSGAQPISTNADSAKWFLLVDAAAAGASASAAAASASAAASSASAASTSASNASSSASSAASSASAASTSASNASTSATNAASSASTASTQASNAATSATNAANSATSASNSASTATTQATNASNSASSASTSATNAANSASSASSSASSASSSASSASTSASNASTSATNAASSATAAAASATSAAASYDSFDDRYLGAKTSDPTLDNDGNALLTGALYFNSSTGEMKVYSGSAWVSSFLTAGAQTIAGVKTFSSNPILDAGTANGVAYLNGSKVLTTGSALSFNGTRLDVNTGTTGPSISVQGGAGAGNEFSMGADSSGGFWQQLGGLPVRWFMNGSEQMRLTSTGLGIGTSSPASKLDVVLSDNGNIDIRQNASASTGFLSWVDSDGERAGRISYDHSSNALRFATAASGTATEKMRLDSAGNLGLGVTPSAWGSNFKAIQVNDTGASLWSYRSGATSNEYLYLSNNSYNNNTNDIYIRDGAAVQYRQLDGTHAWFNAASGTAGNPISFTQAMTLDASGNLGVGTTSPSGRLHIETTSGSAAFLVNSPSATDVGSYISLRKAGSAKFLLGVESTLGGTSDNGTLYVYGANALTMYTNGTERARIDSSGNLLVGTTASSGVRQTIYETTQGATIYQNATTGTGAGNGLYVGISGVDATVYNYENGAVSFATNNTERARITSGGNLLVGTTSNTEGSRIFVRYTLAQSGGSAVIGTEVDDTATLRAIAFRNPNGLVGTITTSGSTTGYNTSSDYRLKDNQQPLTGSGAFIDALKPKTWNWKTDGSKGVGFIAHEVQEVSPASVTGTKDAVDEEGKPIMQAMEYGSAEFIANIIAELQSLRARVAQLEAK